MYLIKYPAIRNTVQSYPYISGLLALTEVGNVPADVYAWTAVLVLPINSAINPSLYTLNVVYGQKASFKPTNDMIKSYIYHMTSRLGVI